MALTGNLSEFSVPEVLQLLALQQKSGVLSLKQDKRLITLYFERGKILGAAGKRREDAEEFLEGLVQSLHITDDQKDTVMDISKETNQDVFTVLVTTGLLGKDRLAEEIHRYTQFVVDDLLEWREGMYEFSGDERSLPHQGVTVKVGPEELLMESMRRKDELATLKESLIQPSLVLAKSPNQPSQPLPRDCQVVLNLVDGRRTVEEVCEDSPLGNYLTYDAVAELLGRQQVIVMDSEQAARYAVNKASTKFSPLAWVLLIVPLAASLLFGTVTSRLFASPEPENASWLPEDLAAKRFEFHEQVVAETARLAGSITPLPDSTK